MSALKPLLRSFQALFRVLTVDLPQQVFRAIARIARPGPSGTQSGFILPTVVMVILVVTLVVAAILARSFDRAKNASSYRVNQLTLSAAAPALDRARAKLDAAFNDPTLPRGTPSDLSLNQVLTRNSYDLPDEIRLRVAFDFRNGSGNFNPDGTIQTDGQLPNQEFMTTAWRFPVDTDNNGRFDSFTLYGIYFRSPSRASSGGFARERTPLDARTPPQDDGSSTSAACAAAQGTSASLVGADGWFKSGSLLKKSFYVYTATVPITNLNEAGLLGSPDNPTAALPANQYEVFRGDRGFTALEYQQDRARIPLGNNAIVYEDDLDLASGTPLRINGRIVTNSNLLATEIQRTTSSLRLYQVSSDESCFYEAENAKIIVGGNVLNRSPGEDKDSTVDVDLFNGSAIDPEKSTIDSTRKSVNNSALDVAYNTLAYEERIKLLVDAAFNRNTFSVSGTYPNRTVSGNDPEAVRDRIEERINAEVNPDDPSRARREELEVWFRNRTRRVPFREVPFGADRATVVLDGFTEATVLQGQGTDELRPPDAWIYPADPNSGNTSGFTELSLVANQLEATDPDQLDERESLLGDRITVGNGLPANWFNPDTGKFADADTRQEVRPATAWTAPAGAPNRYRSTQVRELVDVGLTDRDGFWETKAAEQPENRLDAIGGLRVVTGAGIYLPADSNPDNPNTVKVVWPDTWPQPPDPVVLPSTGPSAVTAHPNYHRIVYDHDNNPSTAPVAIDDNSIPGNRRPYLKMRATAVYHYAHDDDNNPSTPAPPIACVSSFYDPTTRTTAYNRSGLDNSVDTSTGRFADNDLNLPAPGYSNNGITYGPPGAPTVDDPLRYQANLVYPNGRVVNPMLKKAIEKVDRGGTLTLAERAAIDSTRCGLGILAGSLTPNTTPTVGFTLPHGTIQEVAFLDAREVKETDTTYNHQPETRGTTPPFGYSSGNEPNDDSPIEQRQPLEVRVTAINLDELRRQTAPSIATGPQTEWMLPDSGIIFASRDDGLPDLSAREARKPDPADDPDTIYDESNPLVNQALWEVDPDRVSGTDYWLDPTRRPNGIMLFNGLRLARGNDNSYTKSGVADGEEEKGLTLATNLPVYIKAEVGSGSNPGFNVHTQEEFTTALDQATWNNFYTRTAAQLNPNFACRAGDPRLNCPTGDQWRATAVLGDSLTLLSTNFRPGFRNEGGYDLRNNQTDNLFRNIATANYFNSNLHTAFGILPPAQLFAGTPLPGAGIDTIEELRLRVGFWNNEFAINGLSSGNSTAFPGTGSPYTDATYSGNTAQGNVLNSSYFNNFVTPVQRRRDVALEYLMEACDKRPLSECTPNDWYIRLPANPATTPPDPDEKASNTLDQVSPVIAAAPGDAGTTAIAPSGTLKNGTAARRVAFLRVTQHFKSSGYTLVNSPTNIASANVDDLILDSNNYPVLLGIDSGNNVECYTYSTTPVEIQEPTGPTTIHTCQSFTTALPRTANNALWFRTAQNLDNPYIKTTGDEQYEQFGIRPPYIVNPTSPAHSSGYLEVLGVSFAADPQQQPMLHPVLQIHSGDNRRPNEAFGGSSCGGPEYCSHWQPRAAGDATNGSEFNLLMAVGDSPFRSGPFGPKGDFNGGISSLPRVLENWDPLGGNQPTPLTIRGSFIQLKRTNYATAPFWHIKAAAQGNNGTGSLLRYSQRYASNTGRNNSYNPPGRFWGFDVGLLSQFPDLFSQRFTLPPTDDPNEYYREVNRSDDWIESLLCAQNVDPTNPNKSGGRNAVNTTQRPNGCLQ